MNKIYKFNGYVLAGNGLVAKKALQVLSKIDIKCIGVIVHPDEKAREKEKIIKIANRITQNVWLPASFNSYIKDNRSKFKDMILISVYYGYIFSSYALSSFKMAINLHPSFLPYNKGSYTNIWPIIENTPAGVSIHELTEKIDSGNILVRENVPIFSYDIGKSLYKRLEKEAIKLFENNIENILRGVEYEKISNEGGTYHRKDDISNIDKIQLNKKYKAKNLLNILRARTFDDYPSAYYIDEEKKQKVFIRIEFKTEDLD